MNVVQTTDSVVVRTDHVAMLRDEVAEAGAVCARLASSLKALESGLAKPAGAKRVAAYAPDVYKKMNCLVAEIAKARSNVLEMLHWTEHWHPFPGPWSGSKEHP